VNNLTNWHDLNKREMPDLGPATPNNSLNMIVGSTKEGAST